MMTRTLRACFKAVHVRLDLHKVVMTMYGNDLLQEILAIDMLTATDPLWNTVVSISEQIQTRLQTSGCGTKSRKPVPIRKPKINRKLTLM